MQALLRRTGKSKIHSRRLEVGELSLDEETRRVSWKDKKLDLSPKEFMLLKVLMINAGKTLSTEQLLNQVWGYEDSPTTRTIDNFVAKLRQKIETAPHEPEHILTVHGAGYKFVG